MQNGRWVWQTWVLAVVAAASIACAQERLPTVREGRDLYAENGCGGCHGSTGRGDGPVAATLEPRPRDFHHPEAFKKGFDVQIIATTIAEGMLVHAAPATGATGAPIHHEQGMPKFPHLSEIERQSLALYVMSLKGSSR